MTLSLEMNLDYSGHISDKLLRILEARFSTQALPEN